MSKRTLNLLLGVGLLLIIGGVLIALLWPEKPIEQAMEQVLATMPGNAFGKIDNFSYTKSDRGQVLWRIDAERAEYFQDEDRAVLDTMVALFYDDQGREFTLSAARGEMNTATQDIDVSGGITASTSEGFQLITTSAHYDREQGIVSTDDPVLFFGDGITVHAVGMQVRIEDQQVTLKQAVRALVLERSEQSDAQSIPAVPW
ncbi:MAG: LPS export ABC transporter periplasmic protein LptC [Candidatus Alcyoniella australis]|nr:LPS export ABC transporter periplasmic protein LptC [Candidatus Alcyoniella australis]